MKYKYFAYSSGNTAPSTFLAKSTWVQCWSAFQKVLTVKELQSACSICNFYPRVLCFDGVSLAFPKKFVNWSTVDLIPNKSDSVVTPENTTAKEDRLIVRSAKVRALLLDFLENKLDAENFPVLLDGLKKEHSPIRRYIKLMIIFFNLFSY